MLQAGCREGGGKIPLPTASPHDLPAVDVPAGANFLKVTVPPQQPNLPADAPAERLPEQVSMPDPDGIELPDAELLADRSGLR